MTLPPPTIEPPETPCVLTRDQFEFMLSGVEAQYALAFQAAKSIDLYDCDARANARQRRMNQMVENAIIQLEDLTNITVACDYNQAHGKVPFPPKIDHKLTMLNYDNAR